MTTFVTSDTHFGHNNIIKYCNRPFKDVDEMTSVLISNWNSIVTSNDIVCHLGDFSLKKGQYVTDILQKLNGEKTLITGNHDVQGSKNSIGWANVTDKLDIEIDGVRYIMKHFPFTNEEVSIAKRQHAVLLHGHTHYESLDKNNGQYQIDVGVDSWGYRPTNINDIFKYFCKLNNPKWVK